MFNDFPDFSDSFDFESRISNLRNNFPFNRNFDRNFDNKFDFNYKPNFDDEYDMDDEKKGCKQKSYTHTYSYKQDGKNKPIVKNFLIQRYRNGDKNFIKKTNLTKTKRIPMKKEHINEPKIPKSTSSKPEEIQEIKDRIYALKRDKLRKNILKRKTRGN